MVLKACQGTAGRLCSSKMPSKALAGGDSRLQLCADWQWEDIGSGRESIGMSCQVRSSAVVLLMVVQQPQDYSSYTSDTCGIDSETWQ